MEDQQQEDAPPANNRAVKLPPFWTANPQAWFASAEGAFQLRNIADERSRFFNCLHALPEATVCLIADLVQADPLPANPYTELRRRLLAAHQLTDIQRVEQLHNLPPLGSQKPSELLAEMLRLCPRGQENNTFFNCLFFNKLPRELRILLSEADMADMPCVCPANYGASEAFYPFMSFCRILSTLCSRAVFHNVPHFSGRRQKSGTKSTV